MLFGNSDEPLDPSIEEEKEKHGIKKYGKKHPRNNALRVFEEMQERKHDDQYEEDIFDEKR